MASFTDPNSGAKFDCSNPEFQGWLTKQSAWIKDWRRRYFMLKGSKLFFAKKVGGKPHGMIDLAHCMTVKSAELKAKKRHALEVSTPETTFLMFADSEKEKDDWIGAIGRAIVRCSSTYTNEDGAEDNGSDSD
mmetsp:Transcript_24177/g.54541  ORF Transcript_24177/g.54541 Transcript_24177/m.54541 type:complete len:133 (+) Transcript_24177:74-472(+)|eukprot:CAMPEP_0172615764 /NCGR_PEP_ID=MMETSP1068-20121228/62492_1 /TAXON_ID=35684 /ORGANISM="Pseudopedinella elastica, Strain CCMP716" /LENGTH=132 /DNA_ID=CAMNT_0013421011 /DNA_START=7 /DNA_END=405 /DNA_ORIENTATION=+